MSSETLIESPSIGEAEELALMVGRGVSHPRYPLVVQAAGDGGWEFWLGPRLVRHEKLEEASAEFNRIATMLDQPGEKCLNCNEEAVTQDGVFQRDMNSGEILYIEKIRKEWCTRCGTDRYLTSHLRK